ncbi:MAG: ABC transporter permease [Blautia sp.]|nr:ABC transporter permease [Blautia sp.]MDD7371191.1 ABC transporter permease [Bacillota bacterium]MDY3714795.1 ABC transporter permease [Blautia sp.]
MAETKILSQEAHSQLVKRERRANNVWNKLRRNKTAMIGLVIVVFMMAMAILAPMIATHDPNAIKPSETYLGFGEKGHIFGTDEFGRDLFSRIVYGARISLIAAIGGTFVGGIIGILLGLIAGYAGGIVDAVIMRFMDGLLAFPFVLLAIILMTILGSGLQNVILAIGIGNVPTFARVVRGQVHIVKNEEYCNAGRVIGISNARMLFCHILPNTISPIIVYATLNVAGAIISEATLSFLGLGISQPTASWGNILRAGRDCLNTAPHIATISGVFILVTVLGFNLLGDGVRDVLDPKMKR